MELIARKMKKNLTITLFLLMLGLGLKAQTTSTKIYEEKNGFLKVEAEGFYKQTNTTIRKWHILSEKGETASGKKSIKILPDTRVTHGDKLIVGKNFSNEPGKLAVVHYKVNITTPGRYYIWARIYSAGSEDNGMHVGIDGWSAYAMVRRQKPMDMG